jgi:hypothetical protein
MISKPYIETAFITASLKAELSKSLYSVFVRKFKLSIMLNVAAHLEMDHQKMAVAM